MKKLILIISFIFISGISSAQIAIDSIKVYWASGFDSMYLKYTSYIPKVDNLLYISYLDGCGTTPMSLTFIGCSTTVATQKDTLLIFPGGINSTLLRFSTVWDTSSICSYPISTVATDSYIYNVCFPTSINELEKLENKISVYPNPVRNYFTISIQETIQINQVELIDLQGRLVKSYQTIKTKFDVGSVERGVYFLKITTSSGIAMKKMVVD